MYENIMITWLPVGIWIFNVSLNYKFEEVEIMPLVVIKLQKRAAV